jgi:hypothetical protein
MSEQDPDVWDEEREEAEARERYGFMDSGVKWEPKQYKLTPKQEKYRDYMRRRVAAEVSVIGRNGVNYHSMDELPDEHLPDLDFIRCDNLFTARTANAYLQTQRHGRMLGFTFVEDERERSHLGEELRGLALQDAIRHELACRAAELANGGDTVRDISEKLGISIASVSRYLRDKASERSENSKIGKNADFCYRLLQAHGPSLKQTSHFSGYSDGEEVPVDP